MDLLCRSIKNRIILIFISIGILPLMICSTIALSSMYSEFISRDKNKLIDISESIQKFLNFYISERVNELTALSMNSKINPALKYDLEFLRDYQIHNKYFANYFVFDINKRLIMHTYSSSEPKFEYMYFPDNIIKEKGIFFTEPYIPEGTGTVIVIDIVIPIYDANSHSGYLCATLPIQRIFEADKKSLESGKTYEIFFTSASGTVMFCSADKNLLLLEKNYFQNNYKNLSSEKLSGSKQFMELKPIEDNKDTKYFVQSTLNMCGYKLYLGSNKSFVIGPVKQIIWQIIYICIGIVIIITILAFSVASLITKPLITVSRELQQSNIDLEKTNHKLHRAKIEADAANQAKGMFLANMSHEIRTPINAIAGFNYLLSQTNLNDKQKDYVEKTILSAKNLLAIVNDILDFSKIEANELTIENIDFDLYEVISTVSNIMSFRIYEKDLKFRISIGPDIPQMLKGDPFRLNQVLINLMNNAFKFTEKGEIFVKISLERKEDDEVKLKFIVCDTGIGMSDDQISKLFRPFSQADMSNTRKYGGTGLGLSICKSIVELFRGDIYVESVINHGSSFIFTARFEYSMSKLFEQNTSLSIKFLRILLVSCNREIIEVLKNQLEAFNFKINFVQSDSEAIKQLEENEKFDLLIIDWELKDIGGISVAYSIKKQTNLDVPVIIVSALRDNELKMHVDNSRVTSILHYPIGQSQLYNEIVNLLEKEKTASVVDEKVCQNKNDFIKFKSARILLVEDNEFNQIVAKEILQSSGMLVEIATNGVEAVEMAKKFVYDAVLMDLQMPIMDGYEAARNIRQIDNRKNLPIIALSADAFKGVEGRVKEAGMNAMITKPIDPNQIFAELKRLICIEESLGYDHKASDERVGIPSIEFVPGLNIKDGLKRLMGNKETYYKMLELFLDSSSRVMDDMERTLKDKNYNEAKMHAHMLKGMASNLSADDLRCVAEKLDRALLEENYDIIDGLQIEMKAKFLETINSIQQIIGKIPVSDEKIGS